MATNVINDRPIMKGVKEGISFYSLVKCIQAKTLLEFLPNFEKLLTEIVTKLSGQFIEKFIAMLASKSLTSDAFRNIYSKAILAGTSEATFVGLAIFIRNFINFGKVSREDLK